MENVTFYSITDIKNLILNKKYKIGEFIYSYHEFTDVAGADWVIEMECRILDFSSGEYEIEVLREYQSYNGELVRMGNINNKVIRLKEFGNFDNKFGKFGFSYYAKHLK